MAILRTKKIRRSPLGTGWIGFSVPVDALFETLTEDMDREVTAATEARKARKVRACQRRRFLGTPSHPLVHTRTT